jgi:hypothetical protein
MTNQDAAAGAAPAGGEREAFEAWLVSQPSKNRWADAAWAAWLARASLAVVQSPPGSEVAGADARDAARYRHLRTAGLLSSITPTVVIAVYKAGRYQRDKLLTGEDCDVAVDAAMSAGGAALAAAGERK